MSDLIAEEKIRCLRNIFRQGQKSVASQFGPVFYNYFKNILNESYFPHVLNRANHILRLINKNNSTILDLGCGAGLWSTLFAILGNGNKVYGIDYSEERISSFHKLLQYLELDHEVHAEVGDVHSLDYPDDFFDVCFANEILSHVKDLDLALSEISRVLKKGGLFFMSDGNNSISFIDNIQRRKIHKRLEEGPVIQSSTLPDTLFNMRRKMIKSHFRDIDDETVSILAKKTKGMYGEQITRACKEFIAFKEIREKADFPCRNPATGEKMEYPLNPFRLKALLHEKHGINCRVFPLYTTSPIAWKNMAKILLRKTHPVSLLISPEFELIGTKEN